MGITDTIINLTIFVFVLIPFFLVVASPKVKGLGKLGWAVLVLFTSWVGYLAFFIVKSFMAQRIEKP